MPDDTDADEPQLRGPSVDELQEAFPMVSEDQLEYIRGSVTNLTHRTAADVLESAKEQGKVPDEDYHALAAAAADGEALDLQEGDPLDEEPDADPASPHNEQRGQTAMGVLRSRDYGEKAETAVQKGEIADMVGLLAEIDKWVNEAMLDPGRSPSIPGVAKAPIETLADGIVARVDALAAQGKEGELRDAKQQISGMHNQPFRERLLDEIDNKLRLLNNNGDDYEQVRERVLDDTNTPAQTRQLWREATYNADITYEQAAEIGKDVRDWLQEYRELAAEADDEGATAPDA